MVITIIATGSAHAGVTAWKTSGSDLRDHDRKGQLMTNRHDTDQAAECHDAAVAAEVQALREEEEEEAEIEVAESAAALDVPFSLRITNELDAQLRGGARPPSNYRRRRWSAG